ncbi:MAG TPA: hypothetical protein VMB75_07590 [Rhodocyclaceae bacterium]|nr:hypothetical protein [Rhodocyclaceae bacterium]
MKLPKLKTWHRIVIGLLLATLVSWLIHRPDARARQLNDILEAQASPQLKAYPYEFRVLRTEGSTAVMSTPRNFDVPAFRMLGVLYPKINVKNPNDPAFIAVQQALGEVQSEARAIVAAQPGITGVRWELDKSWLRSHGIEVPDNP